MCQKTKQKYKTGIWHKKNDNMAHIKNPGSKLMTRDFIINRLPLLISSYNKLCILITNF